MGEALDSLIWLLVAVLLLLALAAAVLAMRRFLLERGGGTVDCGLRMPAGIGAWWPGVASYHRDELYWYRALGVLLRPRRVFTRRSLNVVSRREARLAEASVLGPGRAVVEMETDSAGKVELAMTPEALTGFLAWLEAAPPSSHLGDIALTLAFNGPTLVSGTVSGPTLVSGTDHGDSSAPALHSRARPRGNWARPALTGPGPHELAGLGRSRTRRLRRLGSYDSSTGGVAAIRSE